MSGEHPNYSIVEICQNTEKSPGDLRRLIVIQTPMKNHRLTLVWKTRKGVIMIKLEGGQIAAIKNDTDNTVTNRMTITRKRTWKEKQLYGRFKRLINDICTWLRKRNFKRETESLLIVAQNKSIRTNQIKARIDNTQQNSRCRLCGDRNETINLIISECSKLAQKEYKTRHN